MVAGDNSGATPEAALADSLFVHALTVLRSAFLVAKLLGPPFLGLGCAFPLDSLVMTLLGLGILGLLLANTRFLGPFIMLAFPLAHDLGLPLVVDAMVDGGDLDG